MGDITISFPCLFLFLHYSTFSLYSDVFSCVYTRFLWQHLAASFFMSRNPLCARYPTFLFHHQLYSIFTVYIYSPTYELHSCYEAGSFIYTYPRSRMIMNNTQSSANQSHYLANFLFSVISRKGFAAFPLPQASKPDQVREIE
ncbi:hypothetical protein P280DRAFT_107129 [Massarina eburnea CBS 473.64]|uniref:Uncharacterized protein n=1 Tax=Massarina eburnea CBS 473.64 TaxID=1395130 RepID=A0A6A6RQ33_9PLEO|nr:hypothetical protein P280DRAFT_107129 [Massarina eburnea CBS 473.64]